MNASDIVGAWHQVESVLFYVPPIRDFYKGYDDSPLPNGERGESVKAATFDLDGTLIQSDRGDKFSMRANDWMLAYENVAETMKSYKDLGYMICIISNRKAPIGSKTVENAKTKIQEAVNGNPFALIIKEQV